MSKIAFWTLLLAFVAALVAAPTPQTMRTRLADGFDQPVGKPDAEGYYMSRGFRPRYHMGEDWNGDDGGNSDLGDPVYCTANGVAVLARDMRMGWGNLVIIRHVFMEEGKMKTVDSVYAHLDKIMVKEGQQIVRGQQVGTIGTNRGMYKAHLHFEIRKNLYIGYNQSGFGKDYTNYYSPTAFIAPRRTLPGKGRSGMVAINTFNLPRNEVAVLQEKKSSRRLPEVETRPSPHKKEPFRVNRFE